jgi:hypothetical protein
MGFFGNLLSGLLGRAASKATGKAVDKVFGSRTTVTTTTSNTQTTKQAATQQVSTQTTAQNTKPAPTKVVLVDGKRSSQVIIPANVKTYFDELLRDNFAEYEVKENIHPKTFSETAEKWFREYTYVLYKGDKAVVAIMLTPHNRNTTQAFGGAREVAIKAGVKFMNFMTHYPNERDYVVNRIKSAL